ncbi:MAG: DUF433 domain-containing protein [Mycobacteriales bacterium]
MDPAKMGGLPCIGDLRLTVRMVLGQLAGGGAFETVLADHPYLDRADIVAALEYAAASRMNVRSPSPDRHEVPARREPPATAGRAAHRRWLRRTTCH